MKTLYKATLAGLISIAVILPVTSFAFQDGNKRVEKVRENPKFKDTDTNGDGAIDMAEFMAKAKMRHQKQGKNGHGGKMGRMGRTGHMGGMSMSGMGGVGMSGAVDANGDGTISREEFSKPALDKAVGRLSKRLNMHFDELDRNDDGQLSKAEQDRPMEKRFERMDQNDDGKLSPEELMGTRHGMGGMRHKVKRGERRGKRQMMHKSKHNKVKEGNK